MMPSRRQSPMKQESTQFTSRMSRTLVSTEDEYTPFAPQDLFRYDAPLFQTSEAYTTAMVPRWEGPLGLLDGSYTSVSQPLDPNYALSLDMMAIAQPAMSEYAFDATSSFGDSQEMSRTLSPNGSLYHRTTNGLPITPPVSDCSGSPSTSQAFPNTDMFGFNYPRPLGQNTFDQDWYRLPSSPPDSLVEGELAYISRYADDEPAPEVENLGPSKLQAYSGPIRRRSNYKPIRPSNERASSPDNSRDSPDSDSRDDAGNKSKPRDDPLYDTKPDQDGFYRCPIPSQDGTCCTHKPTKQKCIFNKYLDSHLRPYTCRFADTKPDCEEVRFSSNACLFRHEREAHGLHNHGHNPYPCLFDKCDRAKSNNGFPRRWNQRDHMKRVHGYVDPENKRGGPSEAPRKKKDGHCPQSVPMARSPSYRRPYQPYTKDRAAVTSSHHHQAIYPPSMPECTVPVNYSLDTVQFAHDPQMPFYPSLDTF